MSRHKFAVAVLTVSACALLALPALADSQARIVRLSDVQGSVQIDKNTGAGFENAFLNLPITQGTQIRTRDTGRAEIEFEDGSTLRLSPNTTAQFSTLGNDDSGKHISIINLVDGMAYVNWLGKDQVTLNFSREKVQLEHAAHFRVETAPNTARFAVFKGDVDVEGPNGKVTVKKKKEVSFDAASDQPYTLAKLEESPLDAWDKESVDYHQQYARNNSSPYGYGASDLGYYGSYTNVAGYGMMWQPYFTGAGWDPFMDGAWSWYPGFGYMFVSSYPWGWMPYRYGNWMYVSGYGWMWQPGYWNSWSNVPRYTGNPPGRFHPPVAPAGAVNTVVVGRGGPVHVGAMPSRVIVNTGSAGMGIARGSLDNLRHLNTQVAKRGPVAVQPTPQFSAGSNRGGGYAARSGSGNASGGARSSANSSSMGAGRSASAPSAPSRSSAPPAAHR